MGKNIFEEDYFGKHRNSQQWDGLKNKSISSVLNLKYKPKKKLDDVLPKKPVLKEKIEEPEVSSNPKVNDDELFDKEYKKQRKYYSTWKNEFLKSVIAGFCGGILVLIVLKISLFEGSPLNLDSLVNIVVLSIVALIFMVVFGLIYGMIERGD